MFEVLLYDGGVYRSEELFELIEDAGGTVIQKTRSSQMLSVTMSIPEEDRAVITAFCKEIGGEVKSVPLAGTEIAVVGPTLGRHHMPHPICDIAEHLRKQGAITVVMGLARGRGKLTSQINLEEKMIIGEYDAAIFSLGNFKPCVEAKTDLFSDIRAPVVLVSGPMPEGAENKCEAIVSGVGRKASRMRTPPEREKLDEIADKVGKILRDKKKLLDEDPLFIHPTEIKHLLEEYEPVNMCLRPAPVVLHLDGLRVKIGYGEHHEDIENMEIYGRKVGDICRLSPSKINDSSILIRIKTRSEVLQEDSVKEGGNDP
ncbi:MAG: methanogenesis marker 7 protein [Candidatus Methanoplasma sp.]|jgi:putative methanogenesis marker protein 7|nr:methanogenesis marker 7 protein [Candidatus Methanoplasma sp.]